MARHGKRFRLRQTWARAHSLHVTTRSVVRVGDCVLNRNASRDVVVAKPRSSRKRRLTRKRASAWQLSRSLVSYVMANCKRLMRRSSTRTIGLTCPILLHVNAKPTILLEAERTLDQYSPLFAEESYTRRHDAEKLRIANGMNGTTSSRE